MADTLTTITNIINSPPGQLAAGGVLAGIYREVAESDPRKANCSLS
jgi:hypothetical protein